VTAAFRARQVWTIARIELRRAFFSKRAIWVYFLALFPALLFFGHGLSLKYMRQRLSARGTVPAAVMDGLARGQTEKEVTERLGTPAIDRSFGGRDRVTVRKGNDVQINMRRTERRSMSYFDGRRRANLEFEDGILRDVSVNPLINFEEERSVYAAVFQYFYLRLAIFFGCLGIFMNLFRGEMLDKTLHYWFLAPARREVLLAGKYMSGLLASSVIFGGGALLSFAAMLWLNDPVEVQAYWQGPGFSHAFWYAASAVLGCVGYGSVFLAAGLLVRNPIVPAAVLLLWESINGFLPAALQKLSVLYYLQSLCPVPPPMDRSAPALVQLLFSPAAPAPRLWAVAGLLAVTALVLWAASSAVRRLEINYSTD
jgi:ABC-type transport system involved in multi-copper enzyme maturation permease subunit